VQADSLMNANGCVDQNRTSTRVGIGEDAKACGDGIVAIGWNSNANNGEFKSEPIPYHQKIQSSVAIGRDTNTTLGVAIGNEAIGGAKEGTLSGQTYIHVGTALGAGTNALGHRSIAIGTMRNRKTYANGLQSIAIGNAVKALGNNAIAIGNSRSDKNGDYNATHTHSAKGYASIALGLYSQADGNNSIVLGRYSKANGLRLVAIGRRTQATEQSATALGDRSQATNKYVTALGHVTKAKGVASTALGSYAATSSRASTAMG